MLQTAKWRFSQLIVKIGTSNLLKNGYTRSKPHVGSEELRSEMSDKAAIRLDKHFRSLVFYVE